MRGKVGFPLLRSFSTRITPACAGKSAQLEGAPPLAQDHPRVCGEKRAPPWKPVYQIGSPPRVRGKAVLYAGLQGGPQDHPRVCGEKLACGILGVLNPGSPPRVRGKGLLAADAVADLRITPACAGKSTNSELSSDCLRDHPRVCGEKTRHRAITLLS